jgi:hypothetical protein
MITATNRRPISITKLSLSDTRAARLANSACGTATTDARVFSAWREQRYRMLTVPNPFDPAALRLDESFAATSGVKKLLTTVPVRKPNRQDFVRANRDPNYRLTPAAIIELKEDRETYLVTPTIASELPGEFGVATLYTTINRQGVLHLWPVKLPGPDGKHNEWHRSAAEAAERAMDRHR